MKKMCLLIAVMLIPLPLTAEGKQPKLPISLSTYYYSEFATHPGLAVSLELPLNKEKSNQFFETLRFGGYSHYLNHTALFIGTEAGYRHIFETGFDFHVLIGINYMHKFLGGTIYEVNENDQLVEVNNYGSPQFMPNLSLGFGYTLGRDSMKPVNIFCRIEGFGEYPYYKYMLSHLAACLGIRIEL